SGAPGTRASAVRRVHSGDSSPASSSLRPAVLPGAVNHAPRGSVGRCESNTSRTRWRRHLRPSAGDSSTSQSPCAAGFTRQPSGSSVSACGARAGRSRSRLLLLGQRREQPALLVLLLLVETPRHDQVL